MGRTENFVRSIWEEFFFRKSCHCTLICPRPWRKPQAVLIASSLPSERSPWVYSADMTPLWLGDSTKERKRAQEVLLLWDIQERAGTLQSAYLQDLVAQGICRYFLQIDGGYLKEEPAWVHNGSCLAESPQGIKYPSSKKLWEALNF